MKEPVFSDQKSATRTTKNWFDQLETVLHSEARLAGLLGHGTMIGNAREFFVSRVLKSVLAPSLHVGTGKIIAYDGSESNQIDIVIYDPSFPFLEVQPGQGIYFVEGVVATIEVKSTIDKQKLQKCLDNCLSVAMLPTYGTTRAVRLQIPQMKPIAIDDSPTFKPVNYVFGYQSRTSSTDTFGSYFEHWWEPMTSEKYRP